MIPIFRDASINPLAKAPVPVADFIGVPTSGAATLTVNFTDESGNSPTSWLWDFGDTNTSTSQNPSHNYAAGTWTVTLTATNQAGSNQVIKTSYITATGGALPIARIPGIGLQVSNVGGQSVLV